MACQFRRYTQIPFSVKTNVSDNLVYTCSRNKQIGKKLYEVPFEFFFNLLEKIVTDCLRNLLKV